MLVFWLGFAFGIGTVITITGAFVLWLIANEYKDAPDKEGDGWLT